MFCSRYGSSGIILMWLDSKWGNIIMEEERASGRNEVVDDMCVMSVGDESCYGNKRETMIVEGRIKDVEGMG